jgi:hypothetical protein
MAWSPMPFLVITQYYSFLYIFWWATVLGYSYPFVAHFLFLKDVLIRTQSCRSKQARYQLSQPYPSSFTYILITPSLLVSRLLILCLCHDYSISSFPYVLITQPLPVDYSSLTCTLITPFLLVSWLFYLYFVLITHCLPEYWFHWLHDDLIFGSNLRIIWE